MREEFTEAVTAASKGRTQTEAHAAFWESFKPKTPAIPTEELVSCTEKLAFNVADQCYELVLRVPFTDEMLDTIRSNEKLKNRWVTKR